MVKNASILFILVCLIAFFAGCGSYYASRLPSNYVEDYSNSVSQNGVSVVARFLDSDDSKRIFSCNMLKKKIQPVFLIIDNKSDVAYGFRKDNIDSRYIYAEEAAKKCAFNHFVYAGIWPPLHVRIAKINDNIRKDYLAKEIVDVSVEPGSSVSGVVFINLLRSGKKVNVPLINRKEGNRLLFEFKSPEIINKETNLWKKRKN